MFKKYKYRFLGLFLILAISLIVGYGQDIVWLRDSNDDISYNSGDVAIDDSVLYVDATNNRIGLNTTSPGATLNICQAVDDNAYGLRITNLAGTSYIDHWLYSGIARVYFNGAEVYRFTGTKITSQKPFQINDYLNLTPMATPSTPAEGWIYANSTDHHLYFYNGSGWVQLDN